MDGVPPLVLPILPAGEPSYFETIPPGEAQAVDAICASILAAVRQDAGAGGVAHRDAHPKMHGCVQALFTVLDGLPDEMRVGVFRAPASYRALVRFSNGSSKPQPDWVGDGRGMAVKLVGVPDSPSGTQDFIGINHPVFFVRNAADYVDFQTKGFGKFIVPRLLPPRLRLHEALCAFAIALKRPDNPLNLRYWSMTPYAFGEQACKFSMRPVPPLSIETERFKHDFLRENMVRHLSERPAAFDVLVQICTDPVTMPIEDPTIAWKESRAPFVRVARLTIPPQTFDTPAIRAMGEALSYTPWHAAPAHRPLGGINRVRRTVYEAVSQARHDFNKQLRAEPVSLPPVLKPMNQGRIVTMTGWLGREVLGLMGTVVDECGFLSREASKLVIDSAVNVTRNRPHPWSTFSDTPTWQGLTDRTYLARHLPPPDPYPADLPAPGVVADLFRRQSGAVRYSNKSTCLFPAFAQYLTDGFLRTNPTNPARTTSNHEIDMCPLYGRTPEQTAALRLNSEAPGRKGRLKSQFIGREEFPPFLYDENLKVTDPAFDWLDTPLFSPGQALKAHPDDPTPPPPPAGSPFALQDGAAVTLFAVGGDRVNSSPFSAMMNTLWLREHNRVAGEIEARNPAWTDERVFQTARNIIIPMFIKIVVEEYINHITPIPFNLVADPSVAWNAKWNRPNWMTAEFSLLYRWHSLMPDAIQWGGKAVPLKQFGLDNRVLLDVGLDSAFTFAASQPTAELGAMNTSDPLMGVETLSVLQARANRLDTYNAYRVAFGMEAATEFSQISSNPAIQAKLADIYGAPDKVEFYPGLFAEDRVPDSPLPGLLMRMVAVDAFSQALTNPLLSEHVWKDNPTKTFTEWGFQEIATTRSLEGILKRQGRPDILPAVSMTQATWHYADNP
jgi:prostaglandin-endoperoxide synthase 2